ncbi:MAG: hypothetical protein V4480_00035 [Patescibacteria group bacterium]
MIKTLYDHMDVEAQWNIAQRYEHKRGCALLADFPSIDTCMRLIGRESDPRACAPHTIRARFGSKTEPEHVGEWLWWENALHRPVDERERLRDLALIFPECARGADE